MKTPSHDEQRHLWNQEHEKPSALLPMDSQKPSSTVSRFVKWMEEQEIDPKSLQGLEMGCGKGRNTIWLADQGMNMTGFDFSEVAIQEATKRMSAEIMSHCKLLVADAIETWPFSDETFDIGIDCFASTDIETLHGRQKARDEFCRVLKPNGILLVSAMADSSPYHRSLVDNNPGEEAGAFLRSSGKFEKTFSKTELLNFYTKKFSVETIELLTTKKIIEEHGAEEISENWWIVLRK